MKLRRGFQAEAKRLADAVREEIGVPPPDALDPWALAEHLSIPVITLSSHEQHAPGACRVLLGAEVGAFSAMVALVGRRRVIIHNDGHALTRQRANISHEIAHVLLFHEPKPCEGQWTQTYDAEQEEEAKWLGGVLLVTDEACVAGCRAGLSVTEVAAQMGVSKELMRWRRNKSGAELRVHRARARQRPAA